VDNIVLYELFCRISDHINVGSLAVVDYKHHVPNTSLHTFKLPCKFYWLPYIRNAFSWLLTSLSESVVVVLVHWPSHAEVSELHGAAGVHQAVSAGHVSVHVLQVSQVPS